MKINPYKLSDTIR